MTYFEPGKTGLREVMGRRQVALSGGLALVLGLLVAGCSSDAGSTPGSGNGGQAPNGAGGAGGVGVGAGGGGGIGAGGAGGITAAGGSAGDSGAGGAGGASVDGQGGSPGTTPIETCMGVVPTGIGVPAGTVATATTEHEADLAASAIDGDLNTEWNAGMETGSITLRFPAPVMIGAIRLHADALPVSNETFTVSTSTSTVPLTSFSWEVVMVPGTLLPEVRIPSGLYSDLTITVNATPSWIGLDEIWLLPSPTCP